MVIQRVETSFVVLSLCLLLHHTSAQQQSCNLLGSNRNGGCSSSYITVDDVASRIYRNAPSTEIEINRGTSQIAWECISSSFPNSVTVSTSANKIRVQFHSSGSITWLWYTCSPLYEDWTSWSPCSLTCGSSGVRIRTRSCSYGCSSSSKMESSPCNPQQACLNLVLTCPADIRLPGESDEGGAIVNYGDVLSSGGEEPYNIDYTQESGTLFPFGTTEVTVTLTDADNGRQTCTLMITVDGTWSTWSSWGACSQTCDGGTQSQTRMCSFSGSCSGGETNQMPCNTRSCLDLHVSCPSNFNGTVEAGQDAGAVNYGDVATSGGTEPYATAYTKKSGTFFQVGTTEVTATVTDAAGGREQCTFTVTLTVAVGEESSLWLSPEIIGAIIGGVCGIIAAIIGALAAIAWCKSK